MLCGTSDQNGMRTQHTTLNPAHINEFISNFMESLISQKMIFLEHQVGNNSL